MKRLLESITSGLRKGEAGVSHSAEAIEKSGWRALSPKRDRAAYDALVGKAAAGKAPEDSAGEALTALLEGSGLDLALPQDRDFLGRCLWEIGQASGEYAAAFREVAVLVREKRVDWLDQRDRLLVLEYLQEIREGTTTRDPWTSLSRACREPGFMIRDPIQRWALLQDRHPRPSSTPLDSVAPAVAERLETIRRDQRLAGAGTVRRFLASLKGREREGLAALAASPAFVDWLLSGTREVLPLPAAELPVRPSIRRLNRLLRELSLRLHLENGAPLFLLQAGYQEAQLILGRRFLDWPPRPLEPESADQETFRNALIGSGKTTGPPSRFAGSVTDLAIMTHNRSRIGDTLRLYAENLIAFGHGGRGVRIHVFDDSTDEGRVGRQRSIGDLADVYAGKGVGIAYFGPEEKAIARVRYRRLLEESAATPEERAHRVLGVEAAIGEGGKGAQRNWILLEVGDRNTAMIDDDVYPWVRVAPGWRTRQVAVDVLSILDRGASVPGALAFCFAYSGVPDWGEGDALQRHGSALQFGVAWQRARLPCFSYAGAAGPKASPRSWHRENWNPVTQGGLLAILGGSRGLASRVPSAATVATDLHCQDFVMGCVHDILSRRKAEERSWTFSPYGALHHGREQTGRSPDQICTALEEGMGCIFHGLLSLIAAEEGASLFALGTAPGTVMMRLGQAIETWLAAGHLQPSLMRQRTDDGPALEEGLVPLIHGLCRLYAAGRRVWLYYPERKAYREAIAAAFARLHWGRLLETPNQPVLGDTEWEPVLVILKQELLGYARTLQVWPALTAVADAAKPQNRGRA